MSCRTGRCKKISLLLAPLAMAILATPAFAQVSTATTCTQDRYNQAVSQSGACTSTPSSNTLGCTANDVSISSVPQGSIHVISGGANTADGPTCFSGGHVTFSGAFNILTTANAKNSGGRDNVGLYFALNPICGSVANGIPCNPAVAFGPGGKTTNAALCGSCADNIISPPHTAAGATCTPGPGAFGCFGSDNYHELDDPAPFTTDNCGDSSSTDNSPSTGGWGFGAGREGVNIQVNDLYCGGQTCTPSPGKTGLVLNYCTTWQTPGSATACLATPPTYPYDTTIVNGHPTAVPGTTSKCNCSTVCLPITPISVTANATKTCTTTLTPTASASCDAGPEGTYLATYTVTVTPSPSSGDAVVDGICDSQYGLLAGSVAGCATLNSGVTNNTCVAGGTIVGGATPPNSYSCSFTAPSIGENNSVVDTVSFTGHASLDNTKTFSATSTSVTVFSEDAPSSATVTKGYVATKAACVTVRYSVTLHNNSGHDEDVTVSGLNDSKFGSITTVHGGTAAEAVLGTTCGVSSGLGTFAGICSGSPGICSSGNVGASCSTNDQCTIAGAGALPTLTVGGTDYVCQFDGEICGTLDTNGCFTHTNSVSATLAADSTDPSGTTCTTVSGTPPTSTTVSCTPTETDLPAGGLAVQECLTAHVPPI